MRIASIIAITLGGLLLSSCTSAGNSGGNFIGDHLPEWAGGLPPDAPPRRGDPGYQAYIRQVDGDQGQPASAPPPRAATAENPSAPKAREQNDQPIR